MCETPPDRVAPAAQLGTDQFGRDVLARILYGGRIDLAIAFGAISVTLVGDAVIGLVAGDRGGRVDAVAAVASLLRGGKYVHEGEPAAAAGAASPEPAGSAGQPAAVGAEAQLAPGQAGGRAAAARPWCRRRSPAPCAGSKAHPAELPGGAADGWLRCAENWWRTA